MGYRFYTSKEFASLARSDARRKARKPRRFWYPVQEELDAVLLKVPAEKLQFATVLTRLHHLSEKQQACAARFVREALCQNV
jgi:hypothetical protein